MELRSVNWVLSAVLLFSMLVPVEAARRALVIGNGQYRHAPLSNPANDATDMAQALKQLDFQVTLLSDLDRSELRGAIRQFGNNLAEDDVGLFYYAGHGMQLDGENFLIPVGSDIQAEDEIPDEGVSVNAVLRKMNAAGNHTNILILDACRNNPFQSEFRSASRGLRRIDGPVGSIIAFSTAPGSVAADGEGRNGLYTRHLLNYLRTSGLTLQQVFTRVRNDVRQGSGGKQIPWESSALTGDVYLAGAPQKAVTDGEALLWQLAQEDGSELMLNKYLARHPEGRFAAKAKAMLQRELGADMARELLVRADYLYFDNHDEVAAFKLYQQAAKQGNPSAMASLAKMWAHGRATGFGKDMEKARYWATQAMPKIRPLAELGHVSSQYQYAVLLKNIDEDHETARHYYELAAHQGHMSAMNNLAGIYTDGDGVEVDYGKANAWYQRAIDAGSATALSNLGSAYLLGRGVSINLAKGLALKRESAQRGDLSAQYDMAKMIRDGEGIEADPARAVALFRKVAERGHGDAAAALGYAYSVGKGVEQDDELALQWYQTGVKLGSAWAMENLGTRYLDGRGVEQDHSEALRLFRRAMTLGKSSAIRRMGVMYEKGQGVSKDLDRANQLYLQAAEEGDAQAMYFLGINYDHGLGFSSDDRKARQWYRKAINEGNIAAAVELGYLLSKGKGGHQDEQQAAELYRQAYEQGNLQGKAYYAIALYNGDGVTRDRKLGARLLQEAAREGSQWAQRQLEQLRL
ncbi:caspase family protein [Ferrimonas pelagia]|uniref:Caspase family p20 domain-containing protein n=1 Tax=Ferrimonas pelagia TaxID=1177826 RepID=A0ABP9FDX4_9GAMM